MTCLDESYGVLKKGVEVCLDQGKARGECCTTKAITQQKIRSYWCLL